MTQWKYDVDLQMESAKAKREQDYRKMNWQAGMLIQVRYSPSRRNEKLLKMVVNSDKGTHDDNGIFVVTIGEDVMCDGHMSHVKWSEISSLIDKSEIKITIFRISHHMVRVSIKQHDFNVYCLTEYIEFLDDQDKSTCSIPYKVVGQISEIAKTLISARQRNII